MKNTILHISCVHNLLSDLWLDADPCFSVVLSVLFVLRALLCFSPPYKDQSLTTMLIWQCSHIFPCSLLILSTLCFIYVVRSTKVRPCTVAFFFFRFICPSGHCVQNSGRKGHFIKCPFCSLLFHTTLLTH